MRLNDLKIPAGSRKVGKRVGRGPGSGLGKTSGRGNKGAKSRSGYTKKIGFSGGAMPILRRIPKRGMSKGSKQNMMRNLRTEYFVLKTSFFNRFETGSVINEEYLLKNNVIRPSMIKKIKILSDGKLEKKIIFSDEFMFSGNAVKEIESKGGSFAVGEKDKKE